MKAHTLKKITKLQAEILYNEGENIYFLNKDSISKPRIINKKDGVNLQWGLETEFNEIVKDYKFWNKKNPTYCINI
jgi:translation elongation factor P/translation initiation factor 5A